MLSYHVSLSREDTSTDVSSMLYYIILEADDAETAAEVAITRARRDYPEGKIDVVDSRLTHPRKKVPVTQSLEFLLQTP